LEKNTVKALMTELRLRNVNNFCKLANGNDLKSARKRANVNNFCKLSIGMHLLRIELFAIGAFAYPTRVYDLIQFRYNQFSADMSK